MPEAVASTTVLPETGTDDRCAEEILKDPIKRAEWLEGALCRQLDMDAEDARMITGVVLEQFGAKQELLDDELDSDVRSIFYTLENKRILTFRRIEYESEDGMTLRGFFWRFHPDGVREDLEKARRQAESGDDGVYENLPSDCWERSAN